jgi:hypothetical protein
VAVLLHFATRGPGFWVPACDAIAPAWLAMLVVAGIGLTLAKRTGRFGVVVRIGALAVAGAATGGTLLALAPQCLAGPFATLPPIVYQLWYLSVHEGRPLWEQQAATVPLLLGLPLAGLIGGVIGWRTAHGAARERWTILLAVLGAATVVAILVLRAGATANALAMPGVGALLARMFARVRLIPRLVRRVAATVGLVPLAAPGVAVTLAMLAVTPEGPAGPARRYPACRRDIDMRALRTLPPGIVFVPLDMAPALLLDTSHRAIAGGYHRGAAAMARVITGFTAAPPAASATVMASGADYLAACPGMPEMDTYRRLAPHGLWARLDRGERFDWLQPLPVRGPALAWRVIRPLPEGRSAP